MLIGNEILATIRLTCSSIGTKINVVCVNNKINKLEEGIEIEVITDSNRYVRVTDDLGETYFNFSSQYNNLLISSKYCGKTINLLKTQLTYIPNEDLLTIILGTGKDDSKNWVQIPELSFYKLYDGTVNGLNNIINNLTHETIDSERCTAKEIEKILKKTKGLIFLRQKGSHRQYITADGCRVTIPFHNRDLAKGTLCSIFKQAGMSKTVYIG